MIRFIGRELSDSSPVNSHVRLLLANNPASMRIVEPLLPQLSGAAGERREPGGSIVTLFADLVTIAPSCSTQVKLDWQSRLVEKFCSREVPFATPAINAA